MNKETLYVVFNGKLAVVAEVSLPPFNFKPEVLMFEKRFYIRKNIDGLNEPKYVESTFYIVPPSAVQERP